MDVNKIMSFEDYLAHSVDGKVAIIGGDSKTLHDGNGATSFVNNGYIESDFGEIDPDTLLADVNTGLGVDGKHHSYVGGVQVISDDGSAVGDQAQWPELYLKESLMSIDADSLNLTQAKELSKLIEGYVDSDLRDMLSNTKVKNAYVDLRSKHPMLKVVDALAKEYKLDKAVLHKAAVQWDKTISDKHSSF